MSTNRKIHARLAGLKDEFSEKLENLAEEYRTSVLIPFCKKHSICFVSGNGSFCFYPADEDLSNFGHRWSVGDVKDAELERKRYLIPCLEVLNEEIFYGEYFGFWVNDVSKEDLAD